MNNDHYHSGVDKKFPESRGKYISERWEQLYNVSVKASHDAIQFLFLINAGGSVAVLGFMGASDAARRACETKTALIFFALGIIFVGIFHAINVHRLEYIFNQWRKNVSLYHNNEESYSKLTSEDEKRSCSIFLEYLFPYLSGIAFVVGLIFGGIALFK